jgi:hypothetical protein
MDMADSRVHDVRKALHHADELVTQLLEERQNLLAACGDLLSFQVESMAAIESVGTVGMTDAFNRRVASLREQYRRPTPAIVKVREAVFSFIGSQPEQHELPLTLCGNPQQSLD